jgi:hypothetical protein
MTDVEYWEECARKAKTTESACAAWGMKIVAAERERCANVCDGLAIATKITGDGEWTRAQRDAVTIACEWLRDEIRKGE